MKAKPLWALPCVLFLFSCAGKEEPRTALEIIQERDRLPALFLTETTHQRVIAPGDKLMIADPKTKEVAWPAHECTNPDCPGRKDGQPFLFINVLVPGHYVKDDGTIAQDPKKSKETSRYRGCPECVKIRQLEKETPEQQARYNLFDKIHILPASALRRAQLDEELKKAMAVDTKK